MRRRLVALVTGLLLWAALPCPAPSCSLCRSFQNMQTLRQEMDRAALVVYGTASNPRFNTGNNARPGSGVTDLNVLRVLKPHPQFGRQPVLQIGRYIPVLDDKKPPQLLIFCDVVNGQLDAYGGRPVRSPALLTYLQGAVAQQGKPRVQSLLYFFEYLDHEDEDVANDAFLEFAKASDDEVAQVGKLLAPDRLRRLILSPKTPPERLTLLAVLLGSGGHAEDAQTLAAMIDHPDARTRGALDGLLCGYIQLQPKAGWDKVMAILADPNRSFPERLAASRVLRFYQNAKPAEARAQIVRGSKLLLAGDMADVALDDLRRWQIWDLTADIVRFYDNPRYSAPITRRAIIRYLLCCPLPEARAFTERLRRRDADLVTEVEETLTFERGQASK